MRYLLDTHTFIWWDSKKVKLSQKVLKICQNLENTLILSVASVWEMQIKSQLGKLTLKVPLSTIIENQVDSNNLQVLPIQLPHILALENLPPHHRNPFDRLLIAQANVENAAILSRDPLLSQYHVKVVW